MTAAELARLVAEMRGQQKLFFNPQTRTGQVLRESKRLEREVDRACKGILDNDKLARGNLFWGQS